MESIDTCQQTLYKIAMGRHTEDEFLRRSKHVYSESHLILVNFQANPADKGGRKPEECHFVGLSVCVVQRERAMRRTVLLSKMCGGSRNGFPEVCDRLRRGSLSARCNVGVRRSIVSSGRQHDLIRLGGIGS